MRKVKFSIGCDPELMLRHKSGQLISAVPIIPEGKGAGREIRHAKGNYVLHDNVTVEFNTAPQTSEEKFIDNLRRVLLGIQREVGKDLILALQASAYYPDSELQTPDAQMFGCESDFCAWFLRMNDPAQMRGTLRSAGGHIHVGFTDPDSKLGKILQDPYGKIAAVRAMDLFQGLAWTFLDKDPSARERRELYGGAGAHRPKDYGFEYRTLGNCWLRTPDHTRLAYKLTRDAMRFLVSNPSLEIYNALPVDRVIKAINTADKETAAELFRDLVWKELAKDTKKLLRKVDQHDGRGFVENWMP